MSLLEVAPTVWTLSTLDEPGPDAFSVKHVFTRQFVSPIAHTNFALADGANVGLLRLDDSLFDSLEVVIEQSLVCDGYGSLDCLIKSSLLFELHLLLAGILCHLSALKDTVRHSQLFRLGFGLRLFELSVKVIHVCINLRGWCFCFDAYKFEA